MIESNFHILTRYRLPAREHNKRLQALEHSIRQLEEYRPKAGRKLTIVNGLIVRYSALLYKLEKKGLR